MSGGVDEDEMSGVRSRVEMFERMATTPKKRAPSLCAEIASPCGKVKEVVHKLTSPAKTAGPRLSFENRDPQAVLSPGKVKDSVKRFQEQAEEAAPKRRRVEPPASATSARSPTIEETELRASLGIRPPVPQQPAFDEPEQPAATACPAEEPEAPASAEAPADIPDGLEQYSLGALWGAGAVPEPAAQLDELPSATEAEEEAAAPEVTAVAAAPQECAPVEACAEEATGLESYALNMRWGEEQKDVEEPAAKPEKAVPEPEAAAVEPRKAAQAADLLDEGESFEIEGLVQVASDDLEAAACAAEPPAEAVACAAEAPAEIVACAADAPAAVELVGALVVEACDDGAFLQEASDCEPLAQSAPAAESAAVADSVGVAGAEGEADEPREIDDDALAREFERQDRERAIARDEADGFQDAIEAEGSDEGAVDTLRKGGVPHHVAHTPITRSLVPSTRSGKKRKMKDLDAQA